MTQEKVNYIYLRIENLDSLWIPICGEGNTDEGDAKVSEVNA